MATASIKTCRHALHALCVAELPGSNLIEANDILRYRTARFSNNATHLVIFSPGQDVTPETVNDVEEGYWFVLKLLARYTNQASEETAEDYLDDLENALIAVLKEAQETDEWSALDLPRATRRNIEKIAGQNYKTCDVFVKLLTR